MLTGSIHKIAIKVFFQIANDPILQRKAYDEGIKAVDNIQVKMGHVNLHTLEEAVEIAANTCIRKDKESQAKVAAFVTGLYMQHDIERAAQVGGSLLKRFGKSYFPRIKDREYRFALEVDSELEDYLYHQILQEK